MFSAIMTEMFRRKMKNKTKDEMGTTNINNSGHIIQQQNQADDYCRKPSKWL